MTKSLLFVSVTVASFATTTPLVAQPSANALTTIVSAGWQSVKKNLTVSAALVPEADYSFKPVPTVRTFGQIVGHLINEHYLLCSAVKGEKNPHAADAEKTTAKAALVTALNESVTYCDAVYASMTDATGTATVEVFGSKLTKLAALNLNVTHDSEHYGNLVTYMRIRGLVPPSSAGQ